MKKSCTVSSRGNSREFEKNASNQGKIGEFVWPKGESGRFTQACGEERMSIRGEGRPLYACVIIVHTSVHTIRTTVEPVLGDHSSWATTITSTDRF